MHPDALLQFGGLETGKILVIIPFKESVITQKSQNEKKQRPAIMRTANRSNNKK
jgi:hypothetical protein